MEQRKWLDILLYESEYYVGLANLLGLSSRKKSAFINKIISNIYSFIPPPLYLLYQTNLSPTMLETNESETNADIILVRHAQSTFN